MDGRALMSIPGDRVEDGGRRLAHPDWFVASWQDGVHTSLVWAPAERVVDLFLGLVSHLRIDLTTRVDVRLTDQRQHRCWSGETLAPDAVTEAVASARWPLAQFGGVELSVATATEQLVLTPELLIVIHARTPRWPFLLEGVGVVQRESLPAPTWRPWKVPPRPAPPLAHALDDLAGRLRLREVAA